MNGTDFLADTNAFIYLLNGDSCMKPYLQTRLAYSVISEMELLSYSGITEQEENNIKALLNNCSKLQLKEEIKERTIKIRKTYNIKLPDAIIAASAIENRLPLITADVGFKKISELNLVLIIPAIK